MNFWLIHKQNECKDLNGAYKHSMFKTKMINFWVILSLELLEIIGVITLLYHYIRLSFMALYKSKPYFPLN